MNPKLLVIEYSQGACSINKSQSLVPLGQPIPKGVHLIERGKCGDLLTMHLHKRRHYEIKRKDRKKFCVDARGKGVLHLKGHLFGYGVILWSRAQNFSALV
jgi:hypothetical protein